MRRQTGDAAPPFRVDDIFGKTVEVPGDRSRFLLISFFRNARCAVCNMRLAQLIHQIQHFEKLGIDVVAVFESAPELTREQFQGRNVPSPITIVADPRATLYDHYGVESSAEKVSRTMERPDAAAVIQAAAVAGFPLIREAGSNFERIPADFLISPDGLIQIAHYGEYVFDHLSLAAIEETVGVGAAV